MEKTAGEALFFAKAYDFFTLFLFRLTSTQLCSSFLCHCTGMFRFLSARRTGMKKAIPIFRIWLLRKRNLCSSTADRTF